MDLAFIAALLLTMYVVAVIAYRAGRTKGRDDMRARLRSMQQRNARLDAAVERRILSDRAHDARHERLRNIERASR